MKVTDEEAQRALSTWCDFDGGLCTSMGAALEEFVANREKEEASEPTPAERVTVGRVVGDFAYIPSSGATLMARLPRMSKSKPR